MSNQITISREVYGFLMGEGPLEGVWFGELNEGLPGAFWWRGVLRSAAAWPEPAQADRNPEGHDREAGHGAKHESPVVASSDDAPHPQPSIGDTE